MPPEKDLLERRLARAENARQQAERLLEEKSLELYEEGQRREQAVVALKDSEERYRLLVQLSPDAILVQAQGRIVYANPAASRLFANEKEAANWIDGRDLQSLSSPQYVEQAEHVLKALERGEQIVSSEEAVQAFDGRNIEVAVTRIAFDYQGESAVQMIARDISQRRQLEGQLLHQATHDALTGLPNRKLLRDRLRAEVDAARDGASSLWVVFLDIDRFKFINDSLGHSAGDQVLMQVADALRAMTTPRDTVARFGGDEFVLLIPDRGHSVDLQRLLNGLMERLIACNEVAGRRIALTCSMGVACFPTDSDGADDLVEKADIAMYCAKQQGRNNWQRFTPVMQAALHDRVIVQTALQTALERDEFFLNFQPQFAGSANQVVGVEVLLRWRHPNLGLVMPDRFIPLAEETGLIVPIGAWVLRSACVQCKQWQERGFESLRLAVNVSPAQFAQADFVPFVAEVLKETGIDAHCVTLEMTENLLMVDVEASIRKLKELKALGVRLSIDDFGTGYSGLSYLKRFPIDELKIDRSFVRDVIADADDASIVLTVIALAHNLNLRVIAEGVETVEQIEYLQRNGCDELQGYYFSRPLPAAECLDYLETGKHIAVRAREAVSSLDG